MLTLFSNPVSHKHNAQTPKKRVDGVYKESNQNSINGFLW
jgi:hypothetical protein